MEYFGNFVKLARASFLLKIQNSFQRGFSKLTAKSIPNKSCLDAKSISYVELTKNKSERNYI